jgi:hypothetical protein
MNPPQGSALVHPKVETYERRDGQWVKKVYTEGERKSVNQALHPTMLVPVGQNACKHEWGPHKGPIPAIAHIPPVYHYQCHLCNKQITSRVKIPVYYPPEAFPKCDHDFKSDSSLGLAYQEWQACTKCGEQRSTK